MCGYWALWHLVGLVARAVHPIDHHLNCVHKVQGQHELIRDGSRLSQLLCGKAGWILQEYSDMSGGMGWIEHTVGSTPFAHLNDLVTLALTVVLHHDVVYHRHAVKPMHASAT